MKKHRIIPGARIEFRGEEIDGHPYQTATLRLGGDGTGEPEQRTEIARIRLECFDGPQDPLRQRWLDLPEFEKGAIESTLRSLAEERGVKAGALIHPVRMALTGASAGPPLFDLVEVMGREATARHLANFAGFRQGVWAPSGG